MSDNISTTEKLMTALISKMENMDNDLQTLKHENVMMKRMLNSPAGILKKAGFVTVNTPLSEDVLPDGFRGDADDIFLKNDDGSSFPQTNEDFHAMSWDDIHDMATTNKTVEVV